MKKLLLTFVLLTSPTLAEVKSKYLKPPSVKHLKFKQLQRTEKTPKALTWTAFGKLVGKVDNLLIIRTKDGSYLLKEDFRLRKDLREVRR